MDAGAKEESTAIRDFLSSQGIEAHVADDSAPGVPEGVFEVRVSSQDAEMADQLLSQNSAPEPPQLDKSSNLDLETVFQAGTGTTSEFEAMSVKNLLEANGIAAVLVGDSVLPNLAFEVRVARDEAALARKLIAEAGTEQ